MATLDWLIRIAQGIRPLQVGGVMVILTLLLAFEDRRMTGLALFVQYGFLGLLTMPYLYPTIALARGVLAIGISVIVYVSAWHAQTSVMRRGQAIKGLSPWGSRRGFSALFYLAALALGGMLVYGLWKAYAPTFVPSTLALAGYWAIAMGLVVALVGEGPWRRGVGLLFIVSGSESIYLAVERGLLIISMVSILDVMLALAIVYTTEMWIEAQRGVGAS